MFCLFLSLSFFLLHLVCGNNHSVHQFSKILFIHRKILTPSRYRAVYLNNMKGFQNIKEIIFVIYFYCGVFCNIQVTHCNNEAEMSTKISFTLQKVQKQRLCILSP